MNKLFLALLVSVLLAGLPEATVAQMRWPGKIPAGTESDEIVHEMDLFPNTWVPKAALAQLGEHAASLKAHPPIKPGTLDPYMPPK